MTVYINGTTGISGVDGSAGTPAVQGTDTNTGVFYPAADTVGVSTGGSERVRVDSSGNVGIGTSSPASRLNIATGASTSCTMRFTANNTGTGAGDRGRLDFYSADNSGNAYQLGYMDYDRADGTGTASYIAWASRVSGTVAERMRINSSGKILFNTTTQNNNEQVGMVYSSNAGVGFSIKDSSAQNGNTFVEFRNGATVAGTITSNGTTTMTYGSASDYRLKENLVPLTGALAKLGSLQPKVGNWKVDGSEFVGFVAHELQEVFPDAVVGEKDRVDADGNPLHQMVDTGSASIIATLTAAIQEQQALITALTARIEALEAK